MEKEYLKVSDVAQIMGIGRSTVRRLIKDGHLAVVRGMKAHIVRKADLDKLLLFKGRDSSKVSQS